MSDAVRSRVRSVALCVAVAIAAVVFLASFVARADAELSFEEIEGESGSSAAGYHINVRKVVDDGGRIDVKIDEPVAPAASPADVAHPYKIT